MDSPSENNMVEKDPEASLSDDNSIPITPAKPVDKFLVDWEEAEPGNPLNWSFARKIGITSILAAMASIASMDSSILAPSEGSISRELNLSTEVTTLVVALYVLGFAFGSLIWAPVSEIWGRRVSLLVALFGLAAFNLGTGFTRTGAALFICRFLSGVMGSSPVSNVSAALGDIWHVRVRGVAVSFYALAVVGGPTLGPVIGAAVNETIGWRWNLYIMAIASAVLVVVGFFALPESYAPVLLKRKAKAKRKTTGDNRWHSKWDAAHMTFGHHLAELSQKYFFLPIRLLVTEPTVTAMAFYASFVYSLLYMTIEVFPIVYLDNRNWQPLVSTLPFIGLFVGCVLALGVNLANNPRYQRIIKEKNNGKAMPEARLLPMITGGVIFVIGLFWFAWTADPSVPYPASLVSIVFIGAGFNIIFQQCINFLVDCYGTRAASAISANTILRSILAAGLSVAASPMVKALGVGPAMSLLGAVATILLPVPILFMKFGHILKRHSHFIESVG